MAEVLMILEILLPALIPILFLGSVITGIALVICSIHQESWGDVLFFPIAFKLGVFLICLPFIVTAGGFLFSRL